MSQFFASDGQSIGVSASTSVLPISFRLDWLDLPAVQGTLKSLLQHHSSNKASNLLYSAFFIVQLLHPYMATGKTIALTRWKFVGKVMPLLFNMLSRLVITFLPRSKCLLTLWLQSPSAVIVETKHGCSLVLLTSVSRPSREWTNTAWPKALTINHTVRLCDVAQGSTIKKDTLIRHSHYDIQRSYR